MTPSATAVAAPFPTSTDELADWLIGAWRRRDDPLEIRAILEAEGWMKREDESTVSFTEGNSALWLSRDLDGDGLDEWIVSIFTGQMASCVTDDFGELWIVNQQGLVYRLFVDHSWNVPVASSSQADLTGDGLPDVVTQSILCGAHTRYGVYHVLSAHRGRIENIIQRGNDLERVVEPLFSSLKTYEGWSTPGVGISSPHYQVADSTGDGLSDLILQGGTYGSVGAGTHRDHREVWSWDGSAISLADIYWAEPTFRLHVLFDANLAFALGNDEAAIECYTRVISDATLDDDMNLVNEEDAYDSPRRFAAFRLELLYLRTGDLQQATSWHDWLLTEYPSSPFAEAADLLMTSWQESRDLTKSCAAVTELLNQSDSPIGSIWETGYGNPLLTIDTVCPIQ
jgi:hypothetical protein